MFLTFRYTFFDTKLILSQHPQQVFYNFKNPFLKIFGKSIIFLIFWMFLHHPSKFGEFSLKIGGEIICQSWPLLTPFFNFHIVHFLIWVESTVGGHAISKRGLYGGGRQMVSGGRRTAEELPTRVISPFVLPFLIPVQYQNGSFPAPNSRKRYQMPGKIDKWSTFMMCWSPPCLFC